MIRKIDRLKNCGVFKNFSWGELDQFKRENLIYGWNYSGKTTLSKLFQSIEFKDKYRLLPGTEFKITVKKDDKFSQYNQSDFDAFPFNIKVFNSQYIKDVFISEDMDLGFQPISFYLGDPSGKLVQRIGELKKKKQRLESIRDNRYKEIIKEFEAYNKSNGRFSAKAKEIRENFLNNLLDQNQLNKGVLKEIADKIKNDLSSYILSSRERDLIKKEAISVAEYSTQNETYDFSQNLENIAMRVKFILEDSAPKTIPFPELDNDRVLFNWVQSGKDLHKNSVVCKFCNQKLPSSRMANLNSYYSNELRGIQNTIEVLEQEIKRERNQLKFSFPDVMMFADKFRTNYQTSLNILKKRAREYDAQLNILEEDLKRKRSHYFENIVARKIQAINLRESVDVIEKVARRQNEWLKDREKHQQTALKKILAHYIAQYLQTENYIEKEKAQKYASEVIIKINSQIASSQKIREKLESELKSQPKGKKELNDTLEILLHRNDLRIEIVDDKFSLERNGEPADNFSEGEKSAIAFAYFLTELKSLKTEEPSKLLNTIVFIDDPISSLDSNHIFQVGSLIMNFFRRADFAQLFVSTHNFEFFSVLLDTNIFGHSNKDKDKNRRPLYYIKRKDDNTSEIKKLPLTFSSYKSEYVALFHTLKEFSELENKHNYSNLLLLPNAMRRFMELYTLMRFPSNQGLDKRVSKVFNPYEKPAHNTKLLHWFSHQQQFEKIQQHDDKLFQIEGAIKELLDHIKEEDDLHWRGLTGL